MRRVNMVAGVVVLCLTLLSLSGGGIPWGGIRGVAAQGTAGTDEVVRELLACVTEYQDDFNNFLQGGAIPNVCLEVTRFSGCLVNATSDKPSISSQNVRLLLGLTQSMALAVGKAASCENIQAFLWAAFFPDEAEAVRPAVRLNRFDEPANCVFAHANNRSKQINLALASGIYNRPDQGVAGLPQGCDRQDRCDNLFRVNPCFDLPCGNTNTSAACHYRELRDVSVVRAFSNADIGDPSTLEYSFRASDNALRLQYYGDTRFDELPLTVRAAKNGTAWCVCACPGATNCSGPPLQTAPDLTCIRNTIGENFKGFQFIFVIPFVLLERRLFTKTHLLWGLIGVPYPFNFLESRSQRLVSALLFTVFATSLFNNFFQLAFSSDTSSFVGTMKTLGETFLRSLQFYPIFLASTCRFYWFGAIIGIFGCMILIYDAIVVASCFLGTVVYFITPVFIFQAIVLCGVIIGFAYRLVRDVRARVDGQLTWLEPSRKEGTSDGLKHLAFYEEQVRDLLRPRTPDEEELEHEDENKSSYRILIEAIVAYWQSFKTQAKATPRNVLETFKESFRLSARLLAVGCMSVGWSILLTTIVILVFPQLVEPVSRYILNTGPDLRCRALPGYVLFPSGATLTATFRFGLGCRTNETILTVVYWVLVGAALITMLTQLFFMLSLFLGHRRRLKGLARGDRRVLPHTLPSPASAIANMVKYLGYQIAHIYMGWLVLYAVYFIILAIIAVSIVLPILDILPRSLLDFWLRQLASFAFAYAFVLLQKLLVYLFFLIDSRSVAVRRRHWFFNFDFFAFLFNAVAGAFIFLQRWAFTTVLALLFTSRLDIPSLPQGYESYDSSYTVYVGVVLVDAFYSNPIVITFVRMMIEGRTDYSGDRRHNTPLAHSCTWTAPVSLSPDGDDDDDGLSYAMNTAEHDKLLPLVEQPLQRRSMVARNRWFVALTLARNPGLQMSRCTHKPLKGKKRSATALASQGDDVLDGADVSDDRGGEDQHGDGGDGWQQEPAEGTPSDHDGAVVEGSASAHDGSRERRESQVSHVSLRPDDAAKRIPLSDVLTMMMRWAIGVAAVAVLACVAVGHSSEGSFEEMGSCPAEGCTATVRRSRVPCMLDDEVCLGSVPKKGVVKPRKALSSQSFYRERAQRHFQQALQWLHEHQFSCDCSKSTIFALEHPYGDGDGYATRLGRLATRIVPRLLEGEVFVVSGGFRGYTDTELCGDRGLECVYRPTSSCLPKGAQRTDVPCNSMSSRSAGKPPKHLLKHGHAWWFGVLLYFMQRPNQDLVSFVQEHVKPLPYIPLLQPHHGAITPEDERASCYIGVQIRKGDKNEARPFKDKHYTEQADFMASELLGHGLMTPWRDPLASAAEADGSSEQGSAQSETADGGDKGSEYGKDKDKDKDKDSDGSKQKETQEQEHEKKAAEQAAEKAEEEEEEEKEKVLAFLATDDKKTAKRIRKKAVKGWDHLRFVMLNNSDTRGVGRPGQSVANYLLRKYAGAEKQYRMTMEIAADTLILSNACGLVGLASSKITLVAASAATASGRLLTMPVAVDAANEYRVRPVKQPSSSERVAHSLWNAPYPPFLDSCCGPM
ncbi:hypothetical protein PTSG_04386 [Salpingoeca rosetta]|uniref:Uncharacterized protein n=1 Tax=Salpingoeca rosetta (strain ATCC 50818 / BSB-021) TaxID=946362 RepID=F2U8E3_SALR5|nr:uncharacterized protein PTSG_04386 [Salpingoeca rosetta]EGD72651.1 hypothetical protein PTSG_04386 [Salpingoeca rosetta]|eukprot:XP_004994474.1 hypothetical protein PTSG_04386 [Salpingoeca rosetta]